MEWVSLSVISVWNMNFLISNMNTRNTQPFLPCLIIISHPRHRFKVLPRYGAPFWDFLLQLHGNTTYKPELPKTPTEENVYIMRWYPTLFSPTSFEGSFNHGRRNCRWTHHRLKTPTRANRNCFIWETQPRGNRSKSRMANRWETRKSPPSKDGYITTIIN